MTNLNGSSHTFAGVVTVPAQSVHQSIKDQVDAALQGVKEGKTMAVLTVKTGAGANVAIAHKMGDDWSVALFVGKSGWQQPISGGVSIAFSR